jgi:EmrB/QacA subfamily drug resistance transporter
LAPATRRWPVLAATCLGAFLGALDFTLVNVAFPDLRASFPGSDLTRLSWVFNGYTIAFAGVLLPAGGLADRFGRRRVYLAGLGTFVAASGLCAAAPSAEALIALRLVQGAGAGILTPLALALVLPQFPAGRRGTAIGLWSASQSAALAVAPSLSGVVVGALGWRAVFLLHLPIGLLALAATWLAVPADPPATGSRLPDLAGVALLVGAIALPTLAIVQSGEWGAASWPTVAAVAGGVGLGVWFVRRSARHPAPVVDLGLLSVRTTRLANVAMFLLGLVMFALQLANVLFLTGVWALSAVSAGLLLTPGPLAHVLAAPLGGRLCNRLGNRAVAVPGALLLAAGTLFLAARTGQRPDYLTAFLPGLLAGSAGVALVVTALSAAAVAEVPADRLATGTAISVNTRAIGAAVGLSSLALVLSQAPAGAAAPYHRVWAVMAAVALGVAAVALTLGPARQPVHRP